MFSEPEVIESPRASKRIRRPRSGLLLVVTAGLFACVLFVWLVAVPVVPALVVLVFVVFVVLVPVVLVPVPVVFVFVLGVVAVGVRELDPLLDVRAVAPVLVKAATDTIGATVGLVMLLPEVLPLVLAALAAASVLDALLVPVLAVDAALASLSPDPQAARLAAKIEQNRVFWSLVVRCFMGVGLLI